jgi:hypothetical protein
MMDKVLVRLCVPSIDLQVDALVPNAIRVEDAVPLLSEAVEAVSRGFYKSTGSEVICVERLGLTLAPGADISMYNLMTGDKLVLI